MKSLWTLPLVLWGAVAGADDAAEGHTWLAARLQELGELRARMPVGQVARHVVTTAGDIDSFSDHVLRDYVEDVLGEFEEHLGEGEHLYYEAVARQRLRTALQERLVDDLTTALATLPQDWQLTDAKFGSDHGSVLLRPQGRERPLLRVLLRRGEPGWRVEDLEIDGHRLSRHYRDEYRQTIADRLSPAVLEAQLLRRDYVLIEDFRASGDGDLPLGWRWRDKDQERRKPYRVRTSAGRTWLAAQDSGGSVILLRYAHWNPRQYPVMTWCWRADAIPPGGDERFGHTNDSVAGIYVFFSQTWIGMPRHIKYVWSSTLDAGTVGRRDRIARPYFVVVESGEENLGRWLFARVDLEEDYDRTWGGRPKDRTQGLGLLTDANSTDSRAEAYYADLRVWSREAVDAGRVVDHCGTYRDLGPMMKAGGPAGAIGTAVGTGVTP